MNKKISLGLSLAITFLAMAVSVAVTMSISIKTYNGLIKDLPQRTQMYTSVSKLDDIIRTNYYGEINEALLNSDLSDGYVKGLGDRFSYYMTADEYKTYSNEMKGEKIGIGVIAVFDEEAGNIYVAEVSSGSPAAKAGLQKGDRIVSIDEEAVTPYNYEDLIAKMTGKMLTTVKVGFIHDGQQMSAGIVNGYTAQTVYYTQNGTVGYIKITDFYETTAAQLKAAIDSLTKQGVTGLLFDLRGTENGFVPYAAQALDVLVPVAFEGSGAIATATDKNGNVIQTFTSDANSVSMPMAVLVNGATSGAAELFACDLRDFGLAQLIGEKTRGNGTLQKIYTLSDGGALMLTVAEIKPYISETYNGVGLTPDIETILSAKETKRLAMLAPEDDAQYKAAYRALTGEDLA